ncbi:family 4C encapsulin nanocompartment shell protein [Rubrivirga sp.]|uniref:family 4C encapsulin nanocompartment shell protein n=1 Tax=Rubrivirga sp. TaxID=1885344 RepID=UPI003C7950F9
MTVLDETNPANLLSTIDQQLQSLRDEGAEPSAILVGPESYAALKMAVAERFGREPADLEQYQWLTVVLDPFRDNRVCVVPTNRESTAGVRAERVG